MGNAQEVRPEPPDPHPITSGCGRRQAARRARGEGDVVPSKTGPNPINPLQVGDIIRVSAGRAPRRVAATKDGDHRTYAELEQMTGQLIRALAARNVGQGDRVVWWGDTCLDAIPLWFALSRLGAVVVPMNPRATPEESGPLLDLADPALVVGDEANEGDAHQGDATHVTLSALLADPARTGITEPVVDENDTHVIFFTSGSSGRPKGVELSHRATRLRTMGDAAMWPAGAMVCMFPQFHMAGWYGPMTVWTSADEVVYVERSVCMPSRRSGAGSSIPTAPPTNSRRCASATRARRPSRPSC